MKKNLIFLTLLISVLIVSVVSAGITGYVARGSGITDSGYSATLQKVDGGVATIRVEAPSGETKIVQVQEGETAKVGDAIITASGLKPGTLFKRGGADVEIVVGSEAVGTAYSHYHVVSPFFFGPSFFQELKGWGQTDSSFPLLKPSPPEMVSMTRIDSSTPIYGKNNVLLGNRFEQDFGCPEGKFLVNAGYRVIYNTDDYINYPDNYVILEDSPEGLGVYHLSVFQSANAKIKINYINVNLICAELEGAEYQETPHFPWNN